MQGGGWWQRLRDRFVPAARGTPPAAFHGDAREWLAFDVAEISDLVAFVGDGDLTHDELDALRTLTTIQSPLLSALNKAAARDGQSERAHLPEHLCGRIAG